MISETITTAILASCVYDILKHSAVVTTSGLKSRLQKWAVDDAMSKDLQRQLAELPLDGDMSESAIERELAKSAGIIEILNKQSPKRTVTIFQTHSGQGDNVAGDKIVK